MRKKGESALLKSFSRDFGSVTFAKLEVHSKTYLQLFPGKAKYCIKLTTAIPGDNFKK